MSITFNAKGDRAEPRPGDRFSQDLDAPDQNAYMVGALAQNLEPSYLSGPVDLETMLDHIVPGDRPVWEWTVHHGWALQTPPAGSDLNVNNGNAIDLFRVLGMSSLVSDAPGLFGCPTSPEPGDLSASELRTRAVSALASPEVDDDRAIATPPTSRGNMHFGGREAGYLDRQLQALIALCDRAELSALCRGSVAIITWA